MPRSRSPSSRKGKSSSRRNKPISHRSPERSQRSHSKSSTSKHKRSDRYQKHRSKSPYRSEHRSSYDRRRRKLSSSSSSSSSSTSNSRDSYSRSSRSNSSNNSRSRLPTVSSKKKQNKINLETTPTRSQVAPCFKSAMEYLDAPVMPETIDAIDADSFVPASFTSAANKKVSQKFVINLSSETVSVPKIPVTDPEEDPIFHQNVRNKIFVVVITI